MKWECPACSYIYDSEQGDMERDIAPGTAWEDVPESWSCPLCGNPKEIFDPLD